MMTMLICAGLLLATEASAACREVDHVPAVIDRPGSYCLVDSHVLALDDGPAILIEADDVHLDLAGNSLRNTAGSRSTASGIWAFDRRNVSVTGGSVTGFRTGVILTGGQAGCINGVVGPYRVHDMAVSGSYSTGIYLVGCDLTVSGNVVSDSGTNFNTTGRGIFAAGTQISITGNDIQGVVGQVQTSMGIFVSNGTGVIQSNRVQSVANGIVMPVGGLVPYRDNTVIEVISGGNAYEGGIDAGGNF